MTTAASTGVGAIFRRMVDSVYEDIAEIVSIDGPSMTRETHDVTTLDSKGGYREHIPGFRDGGTVNLTCLFTRDAFESMKTDFDSDVVNDYEIILPDDENTTLNFEGFVTDMPLTVGEAPMQFTVTIKITGETNLNSGSGSA